MGKTQRVKGRRFEQEVATMFRAAMPSAAETIRRGWQTRKGTDAPDVIVPFFSPECKVGKMPNPRAALEQARSAVTAGTIPLAVIKDDFKEPFVVIGAEDFFGLIGQWWNLRNG